VTRRTKAIVIIIAAVVLVNLALVGIDRLSGGPHAGPVSSSYNSGRQGLAGYADLLRRAGHVVTQERAPLARATLDPSSTVVVLDEEISGDDARALLGFVQRGGRLICGGVISSWLSGLIADPPSLAPIPISDAMPIAPVPEIANVAHVRSTDPAIWTRTRSAVPVLGTSGLTLLAVEDVGAGRIEFLASASPLQDKLLGSVDDAALGLGIAGAPSRPVVFAENGHGFGGTGWRAIPAPARWTFVIGLLAALLWIASRIRRLGPPTPAERSLAPARREYVESLAQTLSRTSGKRAATAPLQRAARERLEHLAALPHDAPDEALLDAAERFGLDRTEALAVLRPAATDDAVVAAGRAYAKLISR
jgi:hypothetical protein